jgi:hypothetical protein
VGTKRWRSETVTQKGERVCFWARGGRGCGAGRLWEVLVWAGVGVFWGFMRVGEGDRRGWARAWRWCGESSAPPGQAIRGLRGGSSVGGELRPFGARVEAVRLPRVALRFTRGWVRTPRWGWERMGGPGFGFRFGFPTPAGWASVRNLRSAGCAEKLRPFGARFWGDCVPRVALRFTRGSVRAPLWGSDSRGWEWAGGCSGFGYTTPAGWASPGRCWRGFGRGVQASETS